MHYLYNCIKGSNLYLLKTTNTVLVGVKRVVSILSIKVKILNPSI